MLFEEYLISILDSPEEIMKHQETIYSGESIVVRLELKIKQFPISIRIL